MADFLWGHELPVEDHPEGCTCGGCGGTPDGFYMDVDGKPVHVLGDKDMPAETLNALYQLAQAAQNAVEDGLFDEECCPFHDYEVIWDDGDRWAGVCMHCGHHHIFEHKS